MPAKSQSTPRSRSRPTAKAAFCWGSCSTVTLPGVSDSETAVELVRAAHKVCPYSNATRGNIEVMLTANGAPRLRVGRR